MWNEDALKQAGVIPTGVPVIPVPVRKRDSSTRAGAAGGAESEYPSDC